MKRKELKAAAKQSFKKHYLLFVVICIAASLLGNGFSSIVDSVDNMSTSRISVSDDLDISINENEGEENIFDVVVATVSGDNKKADAISESLKEKGKEKESNVLGRTNGVFASAVNSLASGSVMINIITAMNKVFGSSSITVAILVILALLIMFAAWFYIKNIIKVVKARLFLEGRRYEKVENQRILFLHNVRRWTKAAWVMAVTYFFRILWALTIVGIFIKVFSYALVPYIVAENPDIGALDAINLSKKMMKGHKWELFIGYVSFAGWMVLDLFTLGLLSVFFLNPYIEAYKAEFYTGIRELAKENGIENCEKLNDKYLFEKADESVLRAAYGDVIELMEQPEEDYRMHGFQGFLANVFGIVLSREGEKEKRFEQGLDRRVTIDAYQDAVSGKRYPFRLFPIPEVTRVKKRSGHSYLRHYSIFSVILMFFVFSFVGWVWEVSLHLVEDGVFVNRGVLHGPWLPIYGAGGVMILVVLYKFRKHPLAEFFTAIALCGIVEYTTAYILEATHGGTKWWDYSGYFLNIHGRVCAEGLLVFGIGGVAMVYVFAPMMENSFRKIPEKLMIIISLTLLGIFAADAVYSHFYPNQGKGISSQSTTVKAVEVSDITSTDVVSVMVDNISYTSE